MKFKQKNMQNPKFINSDGCYNSYEAFEIIMFQSTEIKNALKEINYYDSHVDFYKDYSLFIKAIEATNQLLKVENFMLSNNYTKKINFKLILIEDNVFLKLNFLNGMDKNSNIFGAWFLSFKSGLGLEYNNETYMPLKYAACFNEVIERHNYDKENREEEIDNSKTYLMFDNNRKYYKIGYSNNPIKRESILQAEIPDLKLLFYCDENIERYLHDKYKTKRIRGEWFNLLPDDVLEIHSIMQNKPGFTIIK